MILSNDIVYNIFPFIDIFPSEDSRVKKNERVSIKSTPFYLLSKLQLSSFTMHCLQFISSDHKYHKYKKNILEYCASENRSHSVDNNSYHIPQTLSGLHIDDYGYGDNSLEYMLHLKNNLLELIFLTYINVSIINIMLYITNTFFYLIYIYIYIITHFIY